MARIGIGSNDWATVQQKGVVPIMGGSGWIRLGQYVEYFENPTIIGRLALVNGKKEFAIQDWDDEFHKDLDILIIQRYMNSELARDLQILRGRRSTVIVQDIDDWYWGLDRRNHAAKAADPRLNPGNNIDHYKKVVVLSDYVIASTPYLADRISAFFPAKNIRVQENHVDFQKYTRRVHTEAEKPLIGWFGSTAHRSGDLETLRGVLSPIQDRFGFAHVGDMVGRDGLWADGTQREYPSFHKGVGIRQESMAFTMPLLPPDKLVTDGFQYDIGIVPLNLIPFNHAKSWIKGLEYVAAGIPFIASPSSEYLRFREEYGIGRIAKKPEDWRKHLEELRDPAVRQKEANENLEKAQNLDTRAGAVKLEKILLELL